VVGAARHLAPLVGLGPRARASVPARRGGVETTSTSQHLATIHHHLKHSSQYFGAYQTAKGFAHLGMDAADVPWQVRDAINARTPEEAGRAMRKPLLTTAQVGLALLGARGGREGNSRPEDEWNGGGGGRQQCACGDPTGAAEGAAEAAGCAEGSDEFREAAGEGSAREHSFVCRGGSDSRARSSYGSSQKARPPDPDTGEGKGCSPAIFLSCRD
jgi:hypothetical protein